MAAAAYITFECDGTLFALPVDTVREILDVRPFSALPNAPAHVLGLIDMRGRPVPLLDFRRLLNKPSVPEDEHTRILVLNLERNGKTASVAVRVDRVIEVTALDGGSPEPLTERDLIQWDERMVVGIGRNNGEFVTVLALEGLLGTAALSALNGLEDRAA